MLALQGAEDQYGTEVQTRTIASKVQSGRAVIIERSGHTPHHDQTEAVLALMREFVTDVTSKMSRGAV